MEKKYKRLLEIGEKELDSAEFLQAMEPPPLEIICYLSKTGVITLLKAFIYTNHKKINENATVIQVYEKCLSIESGFKEIEPEIQTFLECPIEIEHPMPENINQSDMKIAIMAARKIHEFVLDKISY